MTEPTKHINVETPEQIEKARKEKEERRKKEAEGVRKTVEDAAHTHQELGKKFLKEDAEEREKKEKEKEKK